MKWSWKLGALIVLFWIVVVWKGFPVALIGAIGTLAGVLLTNEQNRALREGEQKFQADEKQREREMTLRRDVFLPAYEGAQKATSAIGLIMEVSVSKAEAVSNYTNGVGSISKAMLVASPTTVGHIQSFLGELTSAWVDVNPYREQLDRIAAEAEGIRANMRFHEENVVGLVKMQQGVIANSAMDQAALQRLAALIADHRKAAEHERAKLDPLGIRFDETYIAAFEVAMSGVDRILPLQVPLLAAMRNELGLPFDSEAFVKQQRANRDRLASTLSVRISAAKEQIAIARRS